MNGKSFTWTKGRLLNTVATNDGTLNFSYNADGLRVRKYYNSNNYHNYVLEGNKIISDYGKKNGVAFVLHFIYSDEKLIGFTYKNKKYIYLKNIQGDIIGVYNSGSLIASYVYDAWGNHKVYNASGVELDKTSTNAGMINPFRYRGYYYDIERGLAMVGQRYYSPEL